MEEVDRPTKKWLLVAKIVAGWFALINILGYAWFPLDSRAFFDHAYFVVTFIALAGFAVVPRRILLRFRTLIVGLAAVAIALSVPQMFQDITLQGGADYFAVVLRLIVCALLGLMSIEALRASDEAV